MEDPQGKKFTRLLYVLIALGLIIILELALIFGYMYQWEIVGDSGDIIANVDGA